MSGLDHYDGFECNNPQSGRRANECDDKPPYSSDNRVSQSTKNHPTPPPVDYNMGYGTKVLPRVTGNVDLEVQLPRDLRSSLSPSRTSGKGYQRHERYPSNMGEVNRRSRAYSNDLEQGGPHCQRMYHEKRKENSIGRINDYYLHSPKNRDLSNSHGENVSSQHSGETHSNDQYGRSGMSQRQGQTLYSRPVRRSLSPSYSDQRDQDMWIPVDFKRYNKITFHNSESQKGNLHFHDFTVVKVSEHRQHPQQQYRDHDCDDADGRLCYEESPTEAWEEVVNLLPSQMERAKELSEGEIMEALNTVREEPWPMARRKLTWKSLQNKLETQTRWYSVQPVTSMVRRGVTTLHNLLHIVDPWHRVLKRIEGKFGTSVVAVFNFLRNMIQLNMLLALLLLGGVVVPSVLWASSNSNQDYTWEAPKNTSDGNCMCSAPTLTDNNTAAQECNKNYTDYIDKVIQNRQNVAEIQDFLQGTGILEWTVLFAGYYPAYVDHSSYVIGLAYILTILAVYLISLVYVVYFTARFLRQFMGSSSKYSMLYSSIIFAGWDFTVSESEAARIQHTLFICDVKAAFDDEEFLRKKKKRTRKNLATLYFTRALINLVILVLIVGGWTAIYFLVDKLQKSGNTSTENVSQHFLWQYAPTMTVAALDTVYPLIFKSVVTYEHYRGRTELLITLVRCVLIRLMSLAILVITNLTLISQHSNVCDPTVNEYICWETRLGQQVYSVLVLDVLIKVFMTFVVNVARCKLGRFDYAICKRVSRLEFDVSDHTLDIVSIQSICWLGILHAPLMALLCFFCFCILFGLKLFTVSWTCVPPSRLFRASRSSAMFMTILSLTFFVCIIPNGLALLIFTPSKACSPFRGLGYGWQILTYYICNMDNSDSWIRWVLFALDNSIVAVTLLVVVILLLTYYVSVIKARSALVKRLEKKLKYTAKYKTYLVQEIKHVRGAGIGG
ncbi:transmembrane channel-like protein 7 isoform X2 [Cherax quadricarinatus]|uniref:transmembrane channel-like protein 7 isoform X2 n=1 Tax=Cherax quadricarinatus TaxID=27406 RepID=UPI0023789DA3|nr:transmembrane channel-like protein 7 isoform X2 [Cherax quadricarinatus]